MFYTLFTFVNIRLLRLEEGIGRLGLFGFAILFLPYIIKILICDEIVLGVESGRETVGKVKSGKIIIYTVVLFLIVTIMGNKLDFRTDSEKMWDKLGD